MADATLRDFRAADAAEVDRVALAAFEQFRAHYTDWPAMAANVSRMSSLADQSEIVVAEREGRIVGAVAYVGAGRPKAAHFDRSWPIIRLLVVKPQSRGGGVGRALTEECVRRAKRDGAGAIALHTSPIMTVALPLYLRMGFRRLRDAPPLHGVPYGIYLKELSTI
jgi:ribosomal protein S18 acetylase RimI-like enzyme